MVLGKFSLLFLWQLPPKTIIVDVCNNLHCPWFLHMMLGGYSWTVKPVFREHLNIPKSVPTWQVSLNHWVLNMEIGEDTQGMILGPLITMVSSHRESMEYRFYCINLCMACFSRTLLLNTFMVLHCPIRLTHHRPLIQPDCNPNLKF